LTSPLIFDNFVCLLDYTILIIGSDKLSYLFASN
jgi:hypothetical protein